MLMCVCLHSWMYTHRSEYKHKFSCFTHTFKYTATIESNQIREKRERERKWKRDAELKTVDVTDTNVMRWMRCNTTSCFLLCSGSVYVPPHSTEVVLWKKHVSYTCTAALSHLLSSLLHCSARWLNCQQRWLIQRISIPSKYMPYHDVLEC